MTRVLVDSDVLVAALVGRHPRHVEANALLARVERGELGLLVATHALAEVYATLSVYPGRPRLTPAEVERLIAERVVGPAEVVALDGADYVAVLARVAGLGLVSGAVYDALHVRAAEKAGADELVTFNGRDFRRFPPAAPTQLVVL